MNPLSKFCVIQGCPVGRDIGPYIAILVNDARATVNAIYRGQDAAAILHKHGKHSQPELYWLSLYGTPAQRDAVGLNPAGGGVNEPGRSTHEKRSDGVAYPYPVGAVLPWWCQGFDVNDVDVPRVITAARRYGWHVFQPYHSGSEYHHLDFRVQPTRPTPGTALWARLWRLRLTLPAS